MSEPTPHMAAILAQVEAEIKAIVSVGEVGTVTIHCGRNDIVVEVNRKRVPVRLVRNSEPVIRQAR